MMNTLISYRYRDASNNHVDTNVIVAGTLPAKQIQDIAKCLHDGEFFIPGQVGLPENRFDNYNEQDDHPWFELYPENTFEHVEAAPTENITVHAVYANFMAAKDHWNEEAAMARLTGNTSVEPKSALPNPTVNISLKDYMDALFALKGVKTSDVAIAAHISYADMFEIQSAKRPPSYEQLTAIIDVLHLDNTEAANIFDMFGKVWNPYGLPLDIVQFIRNTPDATNMLRKFINAETLFDIIIAQRYREIMTVSSDKALLQRDPEELVKMLRTLENALKALVPLEIKPLFTAEERELIDTPIRSLMINHNWPTRGTNSLIRVGLNSLGIVAYAFKKHPDEFKLIRNLGTKTIGEIEDALNKSGIFNLDFDKLDHHLHMTHPMDGWFFKSIPTSNR